MEISRELAGCQSTIMPAGEKANELRNPNFFAGFGTQIKEPLSSGTICLHYRTYLGRMLVTFQIIVCYRSSVSDAILVSTYIVPNLVLADDQNGGFTALQPSHIRAVGAWQLER